MSTYVYIGIQVYKLRICFPTLAALTLFTHTNVLVSDFVLFCSLALLDIDFLYLTYLTANQGTRQNNRTTEIAGSVGCNSCDETLNCLYYFV